MGWTLLGPLLVNDFFGHSIKISLFNFSEIFDKVPKFFTFYMMGSSFLLILSVIRILQVPEFFICHYLTLFLCPVL